MVVEVFDPEMCCTSGVCGPAPDAALMAFAQTLDAVQARGTRVARYQLSRNPQAFVRNPEVYRLILERGVAPLPIVTVDGKIVSIGAYPDLAALLGEAVLPKAPTANAGGCQCAPRTSCGG